jgi:hypothetical protein
VADIKFIDHTEEVQGLIAELAYQVLEECAGEVESQVKRNNDPYVDTGQTKNSWSHRVTGSMMAGEYKATIGSPLQNAIWEEFGTGEYALNGNGRKGGWFYVDEEGNGHFTHGKHPRRPFQRAYTSLKNKMIKHMQDVFKGKLS